MAPTAFSPPFLQKILLAKGLAKHRTRLNHSRRMAALNNEDDRGRA
jgi:hypothetical protein